MPQSMLKILMNRQILSVQQELQSSSMFLMIALMLSDLSDLSDLSGLDAFQCQL